MLNSYYTEKWTGFQGVEVKKLEKSSDKMVLEIEIKRIEVVCPCCGEKTKKIHDYRWQPVKDLSAFGVQVDHRRSLFSIVRFLRTCASHLDASLSFFRLLSGQMPPKELK